MAIYNKTDDLPRDRIAIEERARGDTGILSAVIVLLIIAAAFGIYFLYEGSDSTTRAVNEPSTTQLAPAATPAPATQPSTQTPTPEIGGGRGIASSQAVPRLSFLG